MSGQNEAVSKLEEASQKNEKEIVLELGTDRFLDYIGVYLIIALAGLSKISELAGNNVSCYPANNVSGYDSDFIQYIRAYCWESSKNLDCPEGGGSTCTSRRNPCESQNATFGDEENLLRNPALVKSFIQWMPYAMLLQAILFALPSAWWHFRVGARLMGHLKFVKLLLNNVYEAVDSLVQCSYKDQPYDEDSHFLNAWKKYQPYKDGEKRANNVNLLHSIGGWREGFRSICVGGKSKGGKTIENERPTLVTGDAGDVVPVVQIVDGQQEHLLGKKEPALDSQDKSQPADGESSRNFQDISTTKAAENKAAAEEPGKDIGTSKATYRDDTRRPRLFSRAFLGDMLDRHLFSMICYENFASLEHHPYILSTYLLTKTPHETKKRDKISVKQGILRQLCHERNFRGRFIVRSYVGKIWLGILFSANWIVH